MTLNSHTEYALRIIIYLMLYPDEIVSTRRIAEKYMISVNHLNKVSQLLSRLDMVTSHRGSGGGIQLNESTLEVRLGDLLQMLAEPTEIAQCLGKKGSDCCVIASVCGLRGIFAGAQQAFWDHLNKYKVSQLKDYDLASMRSMFEKS